MVFIINESKKHMDAKNAVCDMYNGLGDGFKALVEVPLMKYKSGNMWCNTWSGLEWNNQSQVPNFENCKRHYGTEWGPFAICDVAVYRHNCLKYFIEIHATNPVPADKINDIKHQGLRMYEVSADDVMAMDIKNLKNLSTILKRLC